MCIAHWNKSCLLIHLYNGCNPSFLVNVFTWHPGGSAIENRIIVIILCCDLFSDKIKDAGSTPSSPSCDFWSDPVSERGTQC